MFKIFDWVVRIVLSTLCMLCAFFAGATGGIVFVSEIENGNPLTAGILFGWMCFCTCMLTLLALDVIRGNHFKLDLTKL